MKRLIASFAFVVGCAPGPEPIPDAMEEPDPRLTVAIDAAELRYVRPGMNATYDVTIVRESGAGPVEITIASRPGLLARPLVIPPDETTGQLVIRAFSDVTPARLSMELTATLRGATATATFPLEVIGAAGEVDRTFGVDGVVELPSTFGASIAVSQDERLVIGGPDHGDVPGVRLARHDRLGALDPTFGVGGEQFLALSALGFDEVITVFGVAQADGSIVVVGVGEDAQDTDVFLATLTRDGAIDPARPLRRIISPSFEYAHALAPGTDDTSVMCGGRDSEALLMRLLPSGQRDPAFGNAGIVTFKDRDLAFCRHVIVQADGRIVALLSSFASGGLEETALFRFTQSGQLDPSFGSAGKVILPTTADGIPAPRRLASADGATILVAGSRGTDQDVVWRLGADGALDPTFADAGVYATHFVASATVLLPDAEGGTFVIGDALYRLDALGRIDLGFADGLVRTTGLFVSNAALRPHRLLLVGFGDQGLIIRALFR